MRHPIRTLKRQWKLVVSVGLVVALLSVGVSLLFPLQYRADAQVLIISKTRTGVDPYTTVKSAERVGENLAAVIETSDFYEKVRAQSGFAVDWSTFDSRSERKRRKLWTKTIDASVSYGRAILNISAYSRHGAEATQIAGAAARSLVEQGWEYVGGDVTIKVVNSPVVTKWPARPNFVANALFGFFAGMFVMSLAILRRF